MENCIKGGVSYKQYRKHIPKRLPVQHQRPPEVRFNSSQN